MSEQARYFVPGPTWVRPEILQEMTRPMIGHRSPEFKDLFRRINDDLKTLFGTRQTTFVVTASGTGVMQAALENCVKQRVLVTTCGAFSERWYNIAESLGYEVDRLDAGWGNAIDPEALADHLARHTREMTDLRIRDALGIGLAQALALFPGISRSGITISAGLFLGLKCDAAASFAFLMGTPIILGAGIWKTRELLDGSAGAFDPVVLAAGMIAAAISGLVAISFMLSYLRRFNTDVFVVYRLIAAVVFAVLLTLG